MAFTSGVDDRRDCSDLPILSRSERDYSSERGMEVSDSVEEVRR